MSKNKDVAYLPASCTMTTDQALASAWQMEPQDVMILGFDASGDFFTRSSRMSRAHALWLCEQARLHILRPED